MKLALCVGINDYPGTNADLWGCVNDAIDLKEKFEQKGFEVINLCDEDATKEKIISTMENIIAQLSNGDQFIFSYSGHGTYVNDTSGDEEDGFDEALYTYNGPLIDDKIGEVLDTIPRGVKTWVIFDSCFSGTATRIEGHTWRRKFIAPQDYNPNIPVKSRFKEMEGFDWVFFSGCDVYEYSYDAYIDGRYNGAFTRYLLWSIDMSSADPTFEEVYKILRTYLPSDDFPQTPQIEGKEENFQLKIFGSDIPEPEPEPEPQLSWWQELLVKFISWLIQWLNNHN